MNLFEALVRLSACCLLTGVLESLLVLCLQSTNVFIVLILDCPYLLVLPLDHLMHTGVLLLSLRLLTGKLVSLSLDSLLLLGDPVSLSLNDFLFLLHLCNLVQRLLQIVDSCHQIVLVKRKLLVGFDQVCMVT